MFHVEQKKYLLATPKDHLVSKKIFSVFLDHERQVAQTHPSPKPAEMDYYYASDAYISHGNNKKGIVDFLYAWVQKRMFAQKQKWISKHCSSPSSYLDYGCGTGAFLTYLEQKNWEVFGVEPNQKARQQGGKNVFANLNELNASKLEVIALWHVLEHVHQPEDLLNALKAKLAHKGILVIAVPNFNSFDARYYKDAWAGYDVPRHLWHFSKKGLIQMIEKQGYSFEATYPMWFDALYVSYLSEKQKGTLFSLLRGVLVGLLSNAFAVRTKEFSSNVFVFRRD